MAIEAQRVAGLVWDLLKADTGAGGVNTLVSGRIYRDRVPQAAALPAVTVALVSSVPTRTPSEADESSRTCSSTCRVVSDGRSTPTPSPTAWTRAPEQLAA
jgi:hypothetical protein